MTAPKSTSHKTEKQEEFDHQFRTQIVDKVANLAVALIQGLTWVAIAFFVYRTIGTLSGRHTFADIGVKVLANVRISDAVAWLFGGSGVIFGLTERRQKRDKTEYLQERIRQLEISVDPKRTSSSLTPRGTTHARDKL